MFTGIIHHTGTFRGYRKGKKEIAVEAPKIFSEIEIGESVAVNGVCLSLIRKEKHTLFFNLSEETLRKTNLGHLSNGRKLNLELPLTLSAFTSGHLVTGHIDAQSDITKIVQKPSGRRITVSLPSELRKYIIPKGSVAINGVSLTVARTGASHFEIELIPITLEKSNISELKRGNKVNIECDIIGKYVYNWMSQSKE